jgi:hypothetical protein
MCTCNKKGLPQIDEGALVAFKRFLKKLLLIIDRQKDDDD